jgi:copper resistance protein C
MSLASKAGSLASVSLVLASIISGAAFAHTMMKSTSITDGAVLSAAPANFVLVFDHDAGLGSVRLTTAAGEIVPLNFTPSRAMSKSFSIPLPRLEPDQYRLDWRVIASDGHVMASGVSFRVTGAARPAATTGQSSTQPKTKRP